MAGLAHGAATITTLGWATEPIWSTESITPALPVGDAKDLTFLALQLIDDDERRSAVGRHGQACYEREFSIERTVRLLMADGCRSTCL